MAIFGVRVVQTGDAVIPQFAGYADMKIVVMQLFIMETLLLWMRTSATGSLFSYE
jgi:hypothetical protein